MTVAGRNGLIVAAGRVVTPPSELNTSKAITGPADRQPLRLKLPPEMMMISRHALVRYGRFRETTELM